jgi:hypothetical protein
MEHTFTADQIAIACADADLSDAQCESLLIALHYTPAAAPAIQQEGAALDERAIFEADTLALHAAATFGRFPVGGNYNISWVQEQWSGWQRRAALAPLPAQPKPPADADPVDAKPVAWPPSYVLNPSEKIFYSALAQTSEGLPVMTDCDQHGAWDVAMVFEGGHRRPKYVWGFDDTQPAAVQQGSERNAAPDAKDKRIRFLEKLVDAYSPKSYQYDIEHPNDGLNAAQQVKPPTPPAAADSLETSELDALPYDGKDRT